MIFQIALFLTFFSSFKYSLGFSRSCLQPPVEPRADVNCRARIPTIFYDQTKGRCGCFFYGGCGKTANTYSSLNECMSTCDVRSDEQLDNDPCKTLKKNSPPPVQGNNDNKKHGSSAAGPPTREDSTLALHPCDQPLSQGECLDYIPSFYYNKESRICDCFIYSGCKGNKNRFKTMKQCMETCRVIPNDQFITNTCKRDFEGTNILLRLLNDKTLNQKPQPNKQSTCDQPKKAGTCRAHIPSFFYNKGTRLCDCFIYTGCQGNENRFQSLYDCTERCGVDLKDQDVTAACKNHFNRTRILLEILNDSRLRGNNHRPSGLPFSSSGIKFFPALPAHTRTERGLRERFFGILHSFGSAQPKIMSVGDHVGADLLQDKVLED